MCFLFPFLIYPSPLPMPLLYSITNPAKSPPAIAPTTPGTFATAAPVLWAGADAEVVADEVREAEVVRDDDWDALEDCSADDEDAEADADADREAD